MNGLFSIFNKQSAFVPNIKEIFNKGLDTLTHRGYANNSLFLLNKEMNPVENETNKATIAIGACSSQHNSLNTAIHNGNRLVFDGELLNKSELCKTLSVSSGNTSNAELALLLLQKEGTSCFKSLKGFWSLIYLDAENKSVYGARDHIGNRPLFFCNTSNQFAIASESRTLYNLFEDTRQINKNTVIDFLLWGDIGKFDQFFFNGITCLKPSHFVKYEIDTGKLFVERYYTLNYNHSFDSYNEANEKKYLDNIRHLIAESVHENLKPYNKPVAIGVSGGMDSSSLICTAKNTNPEKTIVAYTTTDEYDGGEAYWAEKVVRHTGVEWIKVVCTSNDIVEKLAHANQVHNAPLYNANSLAQYKIMEEVKKQGQAVIIDGQGGDEMLGGYPAYFPLHLNVLRHNGEWTEWWHELTNVANSGCSINEMIMRRLKLISKKYYYNPLRLAQKKRRDEFESLNSKARDFYFTQPLPIAPYKKEVLNDALYESYTMYLANILQWGEHSAASLGIECVMPLSDSIDLAEYVFSIPSSYKIHNGWNKYLLRKAMCGIVPEEICWRKQKTGFYIPEQNWLNEMKDAIFDTILNSEDPEECINKKYIIENWDKLYNPSNPLYQRFAFRCYSYLLWRNGLD
jgi:asparagine synthase (glutamine-hydrolysing)